jgi:hypothetical protein
MSKSKRIELRESYMQGWYQMDIEMLLASTAADFIFDDPAEPEAVTRAILPAYMQRWNRRTRALGGNNQWRLTHESRIDKNGILTDWEWWEVIDSGLQGAALVLTGNAGVFLERITYFDRDRRNGHNESNQLLAP